MVKELSNGKDCLIYIPQKNFEISKIDKRQNIEFYRTIGKHESNLQFH